MKKRVLISVLLVISMCLSFIMPAFAQMPDVSGHWAEEEINEFISKGYVSPYGDDTFKPDQDITRAEFVSLINKAFGFTEMSETKFKDVSETDEFYNDVRIAIKAGYIQGYEDETFRPNNKLSRQEAAVIIVRVLKLDTSGELTNVSKLKDRLMIASWSKPSVNAVLAKGYMKGYDNGTFGPRKKITRAEAITLVNNILKAKEEIKEVGKANIKSIDLTNGNIKINIETKVEGLTEKDFAVSAKLDDKEYTLKDLKFGSENSFTFTPIEQTIFQQKLDIKVAVSQDSKLINGEATSILNIAALNTSLWSSGWGGTRTSKVVTSGKVEYTDNGNGSGTFIITVKDQFENKMTNLTANDFTVSLRGQNYVVGQTPTMAFAVQEDGTYKVVFNAGIAINEVIDVIVKGVTIIDDMHVVISVAPVVTGDQYEPDNNQNQASQISVDGVVQKHSILPLYDIDWIKFTAVAGKTYTINTSNLVPLGEMDTVIELYNESGEYITEDDDARDDEEEYASQIIWKANESGTYYIKVYHWDYESNEPGQFFNALIKTKNKTIRSLMVSNYEEGTGLYDISVLESNTSEADTTPPTNPIINADPVELTNQNVTVSITFSDDSVTKQYKVGAEGEWLNYTEPFTLSANVTVYAKAADAAENKTEEVSLQVNNIRELTSSDLVLTSMPTEQTEVGKVKFRITNESGMNVSYTYEVVGTELKGTGIVPKECTLAARFETPHYFYVNTAHPVTVKIYWGENNEFSTVKASSGQQLDNVSPTATVDYDITALTNRNVVATINPSEPVTVTNNEGLSYIFTENGSFTFNFKDTAGNTGSVTATVNNIDKIPPQNPEVTLSTASPTNEDVIVTVVYPDDAHLKEYKLNNNAWQSYNGPITIAENCDFFARATDTAGNAQTKCVAITNIDKTAPVIIIAPYNVNSTNQNITVSASTNEGTLNETSHTFSANGSFEFVATDAVGNVSKEIVTIDNIDKVSPGKPSMNITSEWTSGQSVAVVLVDGIDNESGVARSEYSLEGATSIAWTTYNQLISITNEGQTKILARTIDNAGNISPIEIGIVVIDRTGPIITLTQTPDIQTKSDITVTVSLKDNGSGVAIKKWASGDRGLLYFAITGNDLNNDTFIATRNDTYTVYAKDNLGNESVKTIIIDNIDRTAPVIKLNGATPITLEVHSAYMEQGATVTDNHDTGLVAEITGTVDTSVLGTYTIKYNARDAAGNIATEKIRTINVVDTQKPIITLKGEPAITLEVGSSYVDAGATATDNYDLDLTGNIVVVNPVKPNVVGTYTITYNVKDSSNNQAVQVTRTVNVVDTQKPIITLKGEPAITLEVGSSYVDAGATATDNYDLDLTGNIVVVNPVKPNVVGTYTITYNVKDSSNNQAVQVTRTVNVVDTQKPIITLNGDAVVIHEVKTVYEDAGVTVTDNYDTELQVVVANLVNPNVVGSYTITYNVKDSSNNQAVQVIRTVNVVDTTKPVINIEGSLSVEVEVKTSYAEVAPTATDNYDGNITEDIVSIGEVDVNQLGEYIITYNVKDSSGNEAVEVVKIVKVVHKRSPILTLKGVSPYIVEVGSTYKDPGVNVSDHYDIDVNVVMDGDIVNSNKIGSYTVTYDATDASGNKAVQVTRTVNVVDKVIPVINLKGSPEITIVVGSIYEDAGATAQDNYDGDLTSKIEISNTVDTSIEGVYTITYNVKDSSKNPAEEVSRIVNVVPIPVKSITLNKSTLELKIGATETLTVTISPDNATYKNVVWESSDTSVATVDNNGNVIAVGLGTATITAKSEKYPDKIASCVVTVVFAGSKAAEANTNYDSYKDAVGVEYKVLFDKSSQNLVFYVRPTSLESESKAKLAYLVIDIADSNSIIGDTSSSFKRAAYIVPGVGDSNAVAGGKFVPLTATEDGWYKYEVLSNTFGNEVGIIVTAATKIPARYVENSLYAGDTLTWVYDNFIKFTNPSPAVPALVPTMQINSIISEDEQTLIEEPQDENVVKEEQEQTDSNLQEQVPGEDEEQQDQPVIDSQDQMPDENNQEPTVDEQRLENGSQEQVPTENDEQNEEPVLDEAAATEEGNAQ